MVTPTFCISLNFFSKIPRDHRYRGYKKNNNNNNKAFIDIRLRPVVTTPIATHRYTARYGQTWCHPQNWNYMTYRNVARGRPSHGHRESAHKILWRSVQYFQRYAHRQTHRQTDRQTGWSQHSAPHIFDFCKRIEEIFEHIVCIMLS